MTDQRPNVLFIITDQHRFDHVGFAGNDVVRTPNIDSLAARGTVFDNAWVANPICMPNRSTLMTGRMPTSHGVIFNDRSLEWGANTHVRKFRDAGYRTALIGKSHLQHWASFPDPHHPMSPPGEWFDRHRPEDMELPATIDDPLTDAVEYIRRISQIHPSKQRMWVQPCGVAGDHDLVRAAIAATYGMIEMIDDRIGQILTALERLDQTKDTIIVFTSDHGDMMGDHQLMLKGRMHYKGSVACRSMTAFRGPAWCL